MRTDMILRADAMDALIKNLGAIDAERFISIVKSDNFNYTEWQREFWKDKTIDEIHLEATKYEMEKRKMKQLNLNQ
jgi:hypothetical protein